MAKLWQRVPRHWKCGLSAGDGIWADYDNDGFLDLYIIQQHKLARFDGENFVDVSSLLPPKQVMRSYGATWGDFDGDGFVDLYVTGFETINNAEPIYDIILKNEAGKGFKHVWNARWKYAGRGVTPQWGALATLQTAREEWYGYHC